MNWDIFFQANEPLDDKLFSPVHLHIPPEFYYQENSESDGHCGLPLQYGTNETNISDFFNSVVNWDGFSYDESRSQKLNSSLFDVKDNGSYIESDVQMPNMMVSNSSNPICRLVILGFATKLLIAL